MHARGTLLHPDFGPPSYGIPFDVVDAAHADVAVEFTYADESDPGPYPFGADTHIEGGSDRHAIMVDGGPARLAAGTSDRRCPPMGRGSASGPAST